MRRLFWLGAGIAVGVMAVRAVRRQAERLTPGGLADTAVNHVGGLLDSVRDFVADVRVGMAEREAELRDGYAWAEADDWDDDEDGTGARR
jgi:hypothetical protein